VQVLVKGEVTLKDSTDLVPGDIVLLSPGEIPADMLLLQGEVVVDEALLTGESVPVRKTPFYPDADSPNIHQQTHRHCICIGGTQVGRQRVLKSTGQLLPY
jgi:P-type E1-E2 ATPase